MSGCLVFATFISAHAEPSPALPQSVPDQALAGRHSGKDWKGLFAYHSSFFSDDDHYGVDVLEKEEPEKFKRFQLRKLMVTIPKVPGEYKLSPLFNVTFFEPPGNNKAATDGILKIKRNGAMYTVTLIAHFDKDNDVRGYFTFTPPEGGITKGPKHELQLKTSVRTAPQTTVTKPKDDHTGDPCAVVRGKYEAALKRIDPSEPLSRDKARRVLTLAGQYRKALGTLYGNLKKQGKIKDAERVKEENIRLKSSAEVVMAKDALTPAARETTASNKTAPKLSSRNKKELRIRVFVDDKDIVNVRGGELWYKHESGALPGKWANNNHPTYVNKKKWIPQWDGKMSRPFEGLNPEFVPQVGTEAKIVHTYGRGTISIVEKPSDKNDQTLSLRFEDLDGGADWLEGVVRW